MLTVRLLFPLISSITYEISKTSFILLILHFCNANIMPEFVPKEDTLIIKIPESPKTPVGSVIHKFKGVDWDGDTLTFTVTGEPTSPKGPVFSVVRTSKTESNLVLKRELDREENSEFILQTFLSDGRTKKSASQSILIIIKDINDNSPKFDDAIKTFEIVENSDVPQIIGVFYANDLDEGPNGEVSYSVKYLEDTDRSLFHLETREDKAELSLVSPLDFENKSKHVIQLIAADNPIFKGAIRKKTVLNITINVLDVSDSPPVFTELASPITEVPEDVPIGSQVLQIKAVDGDSSFNSAILYELLNEQDRFFIEPYSGIIRTQYNFNMDQNPAGIYKLQVRATETGLSKGDETPLNLTEAQKAAHSDMEVIISVTEVWGSPRFINKTYQGHIPENSLPGYPVLMKPGYLAEVYDNDKHGKDLVKLKLEGDENTFEVVPKEGYEHILFQIIVKNPQRLDYERFQELNFNLIAEDSAGNQTKLLVSVFITDQNDNAPTFSESEYIVKIPENPALGLVVGKVAASDRDSGVYGVDGLRYVNLNGYAKPELHLDELSGEVKIIDGENMTISLFDREKYPEIYMTIEVKDNLGKGNSATALLVIQLEDVNDNSPQFFQSFYETEVYENQENVSLALRISAFDEDEPYTNNSKIEYSIANGNDHYINDLATHLGIVPNTGVLFVNKYFDFEEILKSFPEMTLTKNCGLSPCKLPINFTITASDLGNPMKMTHVPFTLFVMDQNDFAPEFTQLLYRVDVREDLKSNQDIIQVKAIDQDISPVYNGVVYKIIQGEGEEDSSQFVIDSTSGIVSLAKRYKDARQLDWDRQTEYTFHVGCTDELNLKGSQNALVIVTVLDVNNKPPMFTGSMEADVTCRQDGIIIMTNISSPFHYTASILENTPMGVNVTTVTAFDPDSSAQLRYSINYHGDNAYFKDGQQLEQDIFGGFQNYLVIDSVSGVISTGQFVFDFEAVDTVRVEVLVEDIAGEVNIPQVAQVLLLIDIRNVQDLKPRFLETVYNAVVTENSPAGTEVVTVIAVEDDELGTEDVKYSIDEDGNEILPFEVDSYQGIIRVAGAIDREFKEFYNFTVRATSGVDLYSSVDVLVQVEDENDNVPIFTEYVEEVALEENAEIGNIVTRVKAIDYDTGAYGEIRYSLEENPSHGIFSIDPITGLISVADRVDREHAESYEIVVKATDNSLGNSSENNGDSRSITKVIHVHVIDVNDHQPVFHFDDTRNEYTVWDNVTENFSIFSFTLTDDDEQGTPNSAVRAKLMQTDKDTASQLFKLVRNDAKDDLGMWNLTTAGLLKGKHGNYTVTLEAWDEGTPPIQTTQQVTIVIKPANKNIIIKAYRFAQETFTTVITPGYPQGTQIFQVVLYDAEGRNDDKTENLTFSLNFDLEKSNSIINSFFSIHPITGIIYLCSDVKNETHTNAFYQLIVNAKWTAEDGSAHSTSANVTVYMISIFQKIQLKPKVSLEVSKARRQSYLIGRDLQKLFGLHVNVEPVIFKADKTAKFLFQVSIICTRTNKVLTSSGIHKIFEFVGLDLGKIFKKFHITYVNKNTFEFKLFGVSMSAILNKAYKLFFGIPSENKSDYGILGSHKFMIPDSNTLYLYYSIIISYIFMLEMLLIVSLKVLSYLFGKCQRCFDLSEEDEENEEGEEIKFNRNICLIDYANLPDEIQDLFIIKLDDGEANSQTGIQSEC